MEFIVVNNETFAPLQAEIDQEEGYPRKGICNGKERTDGFGETDHKIALHPTEIDGYGSIDTLSLSQAMKDRISVIAVGTPTKKIYTKAEMISQGYMEELV